MTSWVCRVQNGQLSSQPGPGHDTLADITHILRPDLRGGSEQDREAVRGEVQRSNSSPSIEDLCLRGRRAPGEVRHHQRGGGPRHGGPGAAARGQTSRRHIQLLPRLHPGLGATSQLRGGKYNK